jgi:hypothetical protein
VISRTHVATNASDCASGRLRMSKHLSHKPDGWDQKPTKMSHASSIDSVAGPMLGPGILDKFLDDTDVLFKTASKNILGDTKTNLSSIQCNGTCGNGPKNMVGSTERG